TLPYESPALSTGIGCILWPEGAGNTQCYRRSMPAQGVPDRTFLWCAFGAFRVKNAVSYPTLE
ncbi:MAG: hypothetical protein O2876_06675, partial [Proteobacteria bacterium]|nr:hypothetical protein [Pseudomonadota bacterium]